MKPDPSVQVTAGETGSPFMETYLPSRPMANVSCIHVHPTHRSGSESRKPPCIPCSSTCRSRLPNDRLALINCTCVTGAHSLIIAPGVKVPADAIRQEGRKEDTHRGLGLQNTSASWATAHVARTLKSAVFVSLSEGKQASQEKKKKTSFFKRQHSSQACLRKSFYLQC